MEIRDTEHLALLAAQQEAMGGNSGSHRLSLFTTLALLKKGAKSAQIILDTAISDLYTEVYAQYGELLAVSENKLAERSAYKLTSRLSKDLRRLDSSNQQAEPLGQTQKQPSARPTLTWAPSYLTAGSVFNGEEETNGARDVNGCCVVC